MSDRHLNAEQARALRERYPKWPRWGQLEAGDWVWCDGEERLVCLAYGGHKNPTIIHTTSPLPSTPWNAADCYLLPTVGDLLDLAAWNAVVNLGCDGETWAARTIGPDWLTADTPLAALYAALKEVQGE